MFSHGCCFARSKNKPISVLVVRYLNTAGPLNSWHVQPQVSVRFFPMFWSVRDALVSVALATLIEIYQIAPTNFG